MVGVLISLLYSSNYSSLNVIICEVNNRCCLTVPMGTGGCHMSANDKLLIEIEDLFDAPTLELRMLFMALRQVFKVIC